MGTLYWWGRGSGGWVCACQHIVVNSYFICEHCIYTFIWLQCIFLALICFCVGGKKIFLKRTTEDVPDDDIKERPPRPWELKVGF